jgi:hypothetical protein
MTATERQRRWRAKVRRQQLLAGKRDKAVLRRRRGTEDAGDQDLWSTPPCLVAAFLQWIEPTLPPDAIIWEAAAGDGRGLVDPLRAAGRQVIATDIEPQRHDIARLDYVLDSPPPETRGAIMVTNGPFSKLTEFLARTLALIDTGHLAGAVLLVRDDFAGTDGRVAYFNRAVAELECCWRARWIPGSTGHPRWWCMWVMWLAGQSGPPVHIRKRRSDLSTRTAEGRSRAKAQGKPIGRAQRKEATRRRAQGATLQELADSYDRSVSTMRRATRTA